MWLHDIVCCYVTQGGTQAPRVSVDHSVLLIFSFNFREYKVLSYLLHLMAAPQQSKKCVCATLENNEVSIRLEVTI